MHRKVFIYCFGKEQKAKSAAKGAEMNRKTFYKTLLMCIALLLVVPVAFAQENVLGTAFEKLGEIIQIILKFYEANPLVGDFFIYLTLFAVSLNSIGAEQMKWGQNHKIIIALILAAFATVAESRLGFSLSDYAIIVLLIGVLTLSTIVYHLIRSIGLGGNLSAGLSFLAAYGMVALIEGL